MHSSSMPEKKPIIITRGVLWGSVVVLLVALTCGRLGVWQLQRLQERRARNEGTIRRMKEAPVELSAMMRDSSGLLLRRVILNGEYDDANTIIIAGRSLRGVPGVHVLTPMRVGGAAVLVNRGWMPSADAARIDVGSIREPAPQNLEGLITAFPGDYGRGAPPDSFQRVWYRMDADKLRKQFAYPVLPVLVQLLPHANQPKYPIRLKPPELDEGPHLGYAIQWFSFAAIAVIGWIALMLRGRSKTIAVIAALFFMHTEASAQMRPLDPVDFSVLSGAPIRVQIGGGVFFDQHAALAGSKGRLLEAGEFRATWRSGRVAAEVGGTIQRFFREDEIVRTPADAVEPATEGKRRDSGDYRFQTVVRLTKETSATIALARFGTRLPTTDNRTGLERDQTDFFGTLGAARKFGALFVAADAGVSINGTRVPNYEQADVLAYGATLEYRGNHVTPFISAVGQEDFHQVARRGTEDMGELRVGARIGNARRWINVIAVRGYREFSPSSGLTVNANAAFGN